MFTTAGAFANTITCSNAKQNLSYSYRLSNGGAYIETTTLTFNGLTQTKMNNNGGNIDIQFSQKKIISQNQPRNGAGKSITYALAQGHVQVEDGAAFSEWVICEEVTQSNCHGPNGRPCP